MNTKAGNDFVIGQKLGAGGYGSVYLCTDENQNKFAIKCVNLDHTGIPAILEPAIMSTIKHPNLQSAIKVYTTKQHLYIVSELAISDLEHWTRETELNKPFSSLDIERWMWQLIQGIACLHKNNILHGDIKASNVLLFLDCLTDNICSSNLSIKLTDFTLSTRPYATENKINLKFYDKYVIYTCTHRSPEVWIGSEWDLSADIWALGCTLGEMLFQRSLFPYQLDKDDSFPQSETDPQFVYRNILCFNNWQENIKKYWSSQYNTDNTLNISHVPLPNFENLSTMEHQLKESLEYFASKNSEKVYFKPPRSLSDIKDEFKSFIPLLLSLLQIEPKNRPTIKYLLKNRMERKKYGLNSYQYIDTPLFIQEFSEVEHRYLESKLQQWIPQELNLEKSPSLKSEATASLKSEAVRLSLLLYNRALPCLNTLNLNTDEKLQVCLFIISKTTNRKSYHLDMSLPQLCECEKVVCEFLSYRV